MDEIIVPAIIIYEVFKKLLIVTSESNALKFIAQIKKCKIIDIDFDNAINAAHYSKEYKLPMADAIIYATAKKFNAELYTMDSHFVGLDNVKYFKKK